MLVVVGLALRVEQALLEDLEGVVLVPYQTVLRQQQELRTQVVVVGVEKGLVGRAVRVAQEL